MMCRMTDGGGSRGWRDTGQSVRMMITLMTGLGTSCNYWPRTGQIIELQMMETTSHKTGDVDHDKMISNVNRILARVLKNQCWFDIPLYLVDFPT